jgi:methionine synthase II (cobalamin-independent)
VTTPRTTTIGSYPVFPAAEDIDYYSKMVASGLADEVTDPFLWSIEESIKDFAAAGMEITSTGQTRGDLYSLFLDPKFVKGVSWRGAEALVSGKVSRISSIRVADAKFARSVLPEHLILKEPVTDAYTLARFAKISTGSYRDTKELARDINRKVLIPEIEDLQKEGGVSMIQLDSPNIAAESSVPHYVKDLVEEVAAVTSVPLVLHVCGDTMRILRFLASLKVQALELDFFHYPRLLDEAARVNFDPAIGLGVLDSQSPRVETVEEIASLIEKGRKALGEDRIGFVHPHCGERSLHREVAFEKNANMALARDDVYAGEPVEPRQVPLERSQYDSKGYFLVTVKRESREMVVAFYTYRHRVVRRYKSSSAEILLQAINDDADFLGISRRHLSYLTLELGRAEASLRPPSVAYRQKLIES